MTDNRILYTTRPILPVDTSTLAAKKAKIVSGAGAEFGKILDHEINNVKFSQHALQRLENRNIAFDQEKLAKLNDAVDKAAQKGAKESLVLMNDLALVVSVKNRTVITAMDGASMKENIFTNIDSAVII
ncbi:MAG: flagellar protein [Pelosinus sp.]|nr:flagellar protein [Pelosinus sp.]